MRHDATGANDQLQRRHPDAVDVTPRSRKVSTVGCSYWRLPENVPLALPSTDVQVP